MINDLAIDLITVMVVLGFSWFFINSWVYENHPKYIKPIFYLFLSLTALTILVCIIASII